MWELYPSFHQRQQQVGHQRWCLAQPYRKVLLLPLAHAKDDRKVRGNRLTDSGDDHAWKPWPLLDRRDTITIVTLVGA